MRRAAAAKDSIPARPAKRPELPCSPAAAPAVFRALMPKKTARKSTARKSAARKSAPRKPAAKPLPLQMLDLITGYWGSQLVAVAARLGIADHLAQKPMSAADLAATVEAEPARLHRVLRALAGLGVLREQGSGRFQLTQLGATLRSDTPGSMRDFAIMMPDAPHFRPWAHLLDGVKANVLPFEMEHRCRPFDYLRQHPDKLAEFSRSMSSISRTENPAVAAAFDFRKVGTLVDVGGSQGHLLATILEKNKKLRGILFDTEQVVAQARTAPFLTAKAVAPRVQFEVGDFFQGVPAGADAYLMKYILHDWDDDECVRILTHCRQAMAKGGRVLAVDCVIPAGNAWHWGKMLDINMLVLTGGRERTEDEFGELFERAGLRMVAVHPTQSALGIVEGVAR
jgi:SAM-dependent methyltransferase